MFYSDSTFIGAFYELKKSTLLCRVLGNYFQIYQCFIRCYSRGGGVFVVLNFSEKKLFINWRLIYSVFVNRVGTT